jgi:hypothetical protein
MKIQTIIHTPVGIFSGVVSEKTEEELNDHWKRLSVNINNFDSFKLNTDDNGTIIVPKQVVNNSVLKIKIVEE